MRGGGVPCAAHDTPPAAACGSCLTHDGGLGGSITSGMSSRWPARPRFRPAEPGSGAATARHRSRWPPRDEIPPRPAAACRAPGVPWMTRVCDPRTSPADFGMASVCGSRRHPWWWLRTPSDPRPEGETATDGTVGHAAAARSRPGRAAYAATMEADAAHVGGAASACAESGGGEPPGAHGSPSPLAASRGGNPRSIPGKSEAALSPVLAITCGSDAST